MRLHIQTQRSPERTERRCHISLRNLLYVQSQPLQLTPLSFPGLRLNAWVIRDSSFSDFTVELSINLCWFYLQMPIRIGPLLITSAMSPTQASSFPHLGYFTGLLTGLPASALIFYSLFAKEQLAYFFYKIYEITVPFCPQTSTTPSCSGE